MLFEGEFDDGKVPPNGADGGFVCSPGSSVEWVMAGSDMSSLQVTVIVASTDNYVGFRMVLAEERISIPQIRDLGF